MSLQLNDDDDGVRTPISVSSTTRPPLSSAAACPTSARSMPTLSSHPDSRSNSGGKNIKKDIVLTSDDSFAHSSSSSSLLVVPTVNQQRGAEETEFSIQLTLSDLSNRLARLERRMETCEVSVLRVAGTAASVHSSPARITRRLSSRGSARYSVPSSTNSVKTVPSSSSSSSTSLSLLVAQVSATHAHVAGSAAAATQRVELGESTDALVHTFVSRHPKRHHIAHDSHRNCNHTDTTLFCSAAEEQGGSELGSGMPSMRLCDYCLIVKMCTPCAACGREWYCSSRCQRLREPLHLPRCVRCAPHDDTDDLRRHVCTI